MYRKNGIKPAKNEKIIINYEIRSSGKFRTIEYVVFSFLITYMYKTQNFSTVAPSSAK